MTSKIVVSFLQSHADFILNTLSPVLWCIFFVLIMDRESLFETWFMPLLGVLAAFLANSVPIGGGIVYIPALSLLGANITLGAAFTISVMPIGNGIFGLLRWIMKDPSVIIWKSFIFTVIPSWIGSAIAILMLPKPNPYWIKILFGWFCFALGILVIFAISQDGLRNVFLNFRFSSSTQKIPTVAELIESQEQELLLMHQQKEASGLTEEPQPIATIGSLLAAADECPVENSEDEENSNPKISVPPAVDALYDSPPPPHHNIEEGSWSVVVLISFLGGIILVPNIGIGPALITYVMLAVMGFPDQHALVTGIVTGGWVCIVPLLFHLFVFQDIPWKLWIMVLPGVFYGAKVKKKEEKETI
jgi:uncharacterized membrane protein YfcA